MTARLIEFALAISAFGTVSWLLLPKSVRELVDAKIKRATDDARRRP